MRANAAAVVVAAATLIGASACSTDNGWRASTEKAISVLIDGSNDHGTHDLDPFDTTPDADQQEIVGDARIDESAESVKLRVTRAADAAGWDAPTCEPINRSEAFGLLTTTSGGNPGQPSFRCELTRDGDTYGQVIIAGIGATTSDILYDLGPDATGFAVGH